VLSVLFNVVEQRHSRSRKPTATPVFSTSIVIFLLVRKNKVYGGKIHGKDDVRQIAHFDRGCD
jgi:hypothetical protein